MNDSSLIMEPNKNMSHKTFKETKFILKNNYNIL